MLRSRQSLLACCTALLAFTVGISANASSPAPLTEATQTDGIQELKLPPLGEAELYLLSSSPEVRLVIRLSDRQVDLYQGEEVAVSYPIAIGKSGWETPTGTFAVLRKTIDPAWRHPFTGEVVPPGPDNPLGVRWIGFWSDGENSIGFHGTPHEELIGQAVSHGCVRMRNADVIDLFEQVEVGTPVIVEP